MPVRFETANSPEELQRLLNIYEGEGWTCQTVMMLLGGDGEPVYHPALERRRAEDGEREWLVVPYPDAEALEIGVNAFQRPWELFAVLHVHLTLYGLTALLRLPKGQSRTEP